MLRPTCLEMDHFVGCGGVFRARVSGLLARGSLGSVAGWSLVLVFASVFHLQ